MSEAPKAPPVIELSTLYFCEGKVPATLALKDCSVPIANCAPDVFSALYGFQSKQEGFMAARDFADKHRLQFTVIDFLVRLDYRINPGLLKEDELGNHDLLAFQRLARSGSEAIGDLLLASPKLDERAATALEAAKPAALLLDRPDLLAILFADPALHHVKVIAHQARPLFADRAMSVGTIPHRHWASITEATCRLNPTTRITLDPPQEVPRSAPAPAGKPRSKPRSR